MTVGLKGGLRFSDWLKEAIVAGEYKPRKVEGKYYTEYDAIELSVRDTTIGIKFYRNNKLMLTLEEDPLFILDTVILSDLEGLVEVQIQYEKGMVALNDTT